MAAPVRVLAERAPLDREDLSLDAAASHHVARVLRARRGDALVVFDGDGCERDATIVEVRQERKAIVVRLRLEGEPRSGVVADSARVHVLQALAKGDKLERVVRACAELGAAAVWPVQCERSVAKLDTHRAEAQRAHLSAISASASEQCGRADLLQVLPVLTLGEAVQRAATVASLRCVADETGGASAAEWLAASGASEGPVALLVGPEGGLADDERALAHRAGFSSITLGPRILRTEHAGAAFCAIASAILGDLKRRG